LELPPRILPPPSASPPPPPEASEVFPRSWLSEQVARGGWSEDLAQRWQSPVIAFGLALLALGLPTSRLLAQTRELVACTDSATWIDSHLLSLPLAKLLADLPSVGAERAWFLLSALCWAGTFPVLFATNLGLGFSRGVALTATLIALAAPAVWLAGTLPTPAGAGLLAASLLLRELLAPWLTEGETPRPASALRAAALWILGCLLHASLALLYPALLVAFVRWGRRTADGARRSALLGPILVAPIALAGLWILASGVSGLAGRPDFLASLWRDIRGGRSDGGDWLLALFMLSASFGPSIAGLMHLLRTGHKSHAERRPYWLLAWCLFPLVFLGAMGRFDLELLALILGPLLPIGLAALLASWKPPALQRRAAVLAAGQLVLTIGFCLAFRLTDPLRAWTRQAEQRLTGEDFVLTSSAEHQHLLRYRFELPSVDLWEPVRLDGAAAQAWWARTSEAVERAHRAGRRVVLDEPTTRLRRYPFEPELRRLMLVAPVVPWERAKFVQERAGSRSTQ
jgi:hypothetical protein